MKTSVIIPAGGAGTRMGSAIEKQFLIIKRKPILEWTISAFNSHPLISEIIVVVPPGKVLSLSKKLFKKYKKIVAITAGGAERVESVTNGFNMLSENQEIILIHDAVRCMISKNSITDVITACKKYPAVTLAVPLKDTIKKVSGSKIINTPDRSLFWNTQTPQGFKREVLKECLNYAAKKSGKPTDECQIAEELGFEAHVVNGSYSNIKITTPEDLTFAKSYLK